jgi:hypothetical protein
VLLGIVVDHLDAVARRVRDEDPPGFCIERAVIEGAVHCIRYLYDADSS